MVLNELTQIYGCVSYLHVTIGRVCAISSTRLRLERDTKDVEHYVVATRLDVPR